MQSRLRRCLAALVALFVVLGIAAAAPAQASTTQCWYASVPSGWGVTHISTSAACGSDTYNTYTITPLTNGLAVCADPTFPPAGWVATSIFNSSNCGPAEGYGNSETVTSALTSGMSICSTGAPVPSGWVVTGLFNSGTCDVFNSSGNSYTIKLPANNMVVCTPPSTIPPGWTVISTFNTGTCLGYVSGGNASEIHS